MSSVDLRNMLRENIVIRSWQLLEAGAERRIHTFKNSSWQAWGDTVREQFIGHMGEMTFCEKGAPLNIRRLLQIELPHCRVENVLYESLLGSDVNASVFMHKKEKIPFSMAGDYGTSRSQLENPK